MAVMKKFVLEVDFEDQDDYEGFVEELHHGATIISEEDMEEGE